MYFFDGIGRVVCTYSLLMMWSIFTVSYGASLNMSILLKDITLLNPANIMYMFYQDMIMQFKTSNFDHWRISTECHSGSRFCFTVSYIVLLNMLTLVKAIISLCNLKSHYIIISLLTPPKIMHYLLPWYHCAIWKTQNKQFWSLTYLGTSHSGSMFSFVYFQVPKADKKC